MQKCLSPSNSQFSQDAFEDQSEEEGGDLEIPKNEKQSHISNNCKGRQQPKPEPIALRCQKQMQNNSFLTLDILNSDLGVSADLSETERKRVTIELQAKNQLIQESQAKNDFSGKVLGKPENNKIEGFFPETQALRFQTKIKEQGSKKKKEARYSNLSNLHGELQYWSQKDHYPKGASLRKDQRKRQQHHLDHPNHLIRSLLCKINNIRGLDSQPNSYENLNQKFIALQQKCLRKKGPMKKMALRMKTEGDESINNAKYVSSLDIRKLIQPSSLYLKHKSSRQKEYPFNLKTNEEGIKTKYSHFRSSNQQSNTHNRTLSTGAINAYEESSSSRKDISMDTGKAKSKFQVANEKIAKMFSRLKQLKSKQKSGNAIGSLHSIHSAQSREQSALKLQWNAQKNKLRNKIVKSSTENISKFSSNVQRKNALTQNTTGRQDRSCKIISPIFVSFQKQ